MRLTESQQKFILFLHSFYADSKVRQPLFLPLSISLSNFFNNPCSDHKFRPLSFEIITHVAIDTVHSRSVESVLR